MEPETTTGDPSTPPGTTAPVARFGIATDGPIRAWQARAIEALASVRGLTIVRWDRHAPVAGAAGPDAGALRIVDIPTPLRDLPHHDQRDGEVDIVLDLTATGVAVGSMAGAPDVWRFGYGPAASRDAARTALFEYATTPTQARVTLISEPSGAVLREGLLTCRREERLDRMLFDTAAWPASVAVTRLDGSGSGQSLGRRAATGSDPAAAIPRPILQVAALGRRGLRMRAALTRHDDWNVGVISEPIDEVVADGGSGRVEWFPLRPGRFAADPFGVERDGVLHVFFEDYDQREGRGVIAHTAIEPDGRSSDPVVVLDTGLHASYPFIVEDGGATYMLPELSAANELVLYAATSFPTGWEPVATLLTGIRVVDATVVRHLDRWWMFATIADLGAGHNLFLWHAPALAGPWTPHAANPVKTDARSARPGGTPYLVDGVLYRPSQDCSVTYGGAVIVCRIDVLTPREFLETPIRSIAPRADSPHRDGLHTLSSVGGRTLIDSKTTHLVSGVLERQLGGRVPFADRVIRRSRP
jgi:hypothetical protein